MAISLQSGFPVFGPGSGTTDTTSVTVNSGSDRLMVVCVTGEGFFANDVDVSSVTFGGVALSSHADADKAGDWTWAEMWYLKNPSVSTADVVVTLSETDDFYVGILVLDGVDQTTTFRTPGTATGSNTTSSITVGSVASGDYLIDVLCIDSTGHSPVAGANQTELWDPANDVGHDSAASTQAGADGGAMSWTWTTSSAFSHLATAVIPASAGGGRVTNRNLLAGVG